MASVQSNAKLEPCLICSLTVCLQRLSPIEWLHLGPRGPNIAPRSILIFFFGANHFAPDVFELTGPGVPSDANMDGLGL